MDPMAHTGQAIGAIDIGGTKISASIAQADGPLLRLMAPTPKSGSVRALPERAIALLEEVCDQAGIASREVHIVGVSSCGPFDRRDGLVGLRSPNICGAGNCAVDLPNDWRVIPLEAVLRERFKHVVIENDCVAALAAERSFGALQDEDHCAYVTWSTGIGFGLCVDGHILKGKNGNAGHVGHMLMSETDDALCGCGNRGDLEALVSGRNLSNRFGQSTAILFQSAQQGDSEACTIATAAACRLGRALYNLTATLDLTAFAVGGSVWQHHGTWLLPIVQKEITDRLPALTRGVTVRDAGLGPHVGDVAAFSLVLPATWLPSWQVTKPWNAMTTRAG
jgi:glucokinase